MSNDLFCGFGTDDHPCILEMCACDHSLGPPVWLSVEPQTAVGQRDERPPREACCVHMMMEVEQQVQADSATVTHTADSARWSCAIISVIVIMSDRDGEQQSHNNLDWFLTEFECNWRSSIDLKWSELLQSEWKDKLHKVRHLSVASWRFWQKWLLSFLFFFSTRQRLTELSACERLLSHLWD